MGWNSGYAAMEAFVIAVYDTGALTPEVLDKIMEPYKGTHCDSSRSRDVKTKDGLGVKEVICKTMKPLEYEDAIKKSTFTANENFQAAFDSIWKDMWHMW